MRGTGADEREPDGDWVDRFVLPFVREPTLWPVLVVGIGHAAAFLAPVLLWTLRERNPLALAPLLALLVGSAATLRFEWRRSGRPGALSAVLLATWGLGALFAYLADRYAIF